MGPAETKTTAAARQGIFYGWYIVGLAFIASAMSGGVSAYTLGVFLRPMAEELGWSRTLVSGVQSVTTLVHGLLSPFIGPVLDRRGGKGLMVLGALLSGAGLVGLAVVSQWWHFYLFRGVVFTLGNLGMGMLVANVAISNWFVRKRGRAIAIGAMGISVAAAVLPPVCERLIAAYGWRAAWVVLGVLTWVLVIPAAALIMRRRPEDLGLYPDGDPPERAAAVSKAGARASEAWLTRNAVWTRWAALRTPALWLIIAAFGLAGMGMSALLLHLVPFLQDAGHSPAAAAGGITALGLAGLLSKPVWGLLVERFPVRYCAVAEFLLCGSGIGAILAAGSSGSLALAYLASFYFGIGIGGVVTVQEVVWANYYGRLTLGTVRSLGVPFMIAASAGGPVLAGLTFDLTHSYRQAFLLFLATYAFAAVLISLARPPTPPAEGTRAAPPVA